MKKVLLLGISILLSSSLFADDYSAWPTYSGAPGGERYSSLTQINPDNLAQLSVAWETHTGDISNGSGKIPSTAFEATPILFHNHLYICTPFNRVLALNPGTGKILWSYDPKMNLENHAVQNGLMCRGVSAWTDENASENSSCKYRIITATHDGRLISLDANNGKVCLGFGDKGEVNLKTVSPMSKETMTAAGIPEYHQATAAQVWLAQGGSTSAPAIIDNVIVVGMTLDDNFMAAMPSGVLRGYDAVTGKLLWTFNPIPENLQGKVGSSNVWAPITVDPENHLIFAGTTSPSPDFYGASRTEDIPYANAIIAINSQTGKLVWAYQTVHHDLYDYDIASQPTLITVQRGGKSIPALVQGTKSGFIFILNRLTGQPLFPIEQRMIPNSTVPGEQTSLTQPVPVLPKPLVSLILTKQSMWGITPIDRAWCEDQFTKYRYDGLFTPPSVQGSIEFPFTGGGINWGGVSYSPQSNLIFVNFSRVAHIVKLLPRAEANKIGYPAPELEPAFGSPYAVKREIFLSPLGVPCTPPPWGQLAAIDVNTGKIRWEVPFGSVKKTLFSSPAAWGSPNIGGSLVTASGLLFIGASMDDVFHVYNAWTGDLLQTIKLPAQGAATPMTYQYQGKQYVVIAAGGGRGSPPSLQGDSLIAFALK